MRGVAASALAQGARIVLQLLSLVILARLLTPDDYGLFAMVIALIGVGELLREMGLSSAAIQAESLTRGQRDNLFWINTALGVAVSVVVASVAPLIALFYGRDEVTTITLWLSLTFVMSGVTAQYRAQLVRDLRFSVLAMVDIACAAVALACGVMFALAGWGYLALVGQQLVGGAFGLIVIVLVSGWLPRRYDRREPMGNLVRFGTKIFASQVVTYTSNNLDSVIIGSRIGAVDLGLYNRGLQLVRTPMNQLRAPIGTVALPVLSRVRGDHVRFMRFVSRGQLAAGLPIMMGVGWFIVVAPQMIDLALGDTWAETVTIVRWIAFGEGISSLMFVASWMYVSLGLGRELVQFGLFTLGVRAISLLVGVQFGVEGVAASVAVGPAIVFPIALWQVGRATGLPVRQLFVQGVRLAGLALIVTSLTWLVVTQLDRPGNLVVLAVASLVHLAGMLTAAAVPVVRADYLLFWRTLRAIRN